MVNKTKWMEKMLVEVGVKGTVFNSQTLYSFPVTAVINHHQPSGLKEHNVTILQLCGQKSEVDLMMLESKWMNFTQYWWNYKLLFLLFCATDFEQVLSIIFLPLDEISKK